MSTREQGRIASLETQLNEELCDALDTDRVFYTITKARQVNVYAAYDHDSRKIAVIKAFDMDVVAEILCRLHSDVKPKRIPYEVDYSGTPCIGASFSIVPERSMVESAVDVTFRLDIEHNENGRSVENLLYTGMTFSFDTHEDDFIITHAEITGHDFREDITLEKDE